MILRKNGVNMVNGMETADTPPSKIVESVKEISNAVELVYEPGLTITITGDKLSKVDNICVYFKEDK